MMGTGRLLYFTLFGITLVEYWYNIGEKVRGKYTIAIHAERLEDNHYGNELISNSFICTRWS